MFIAWIILSIAVGVIGSYKRLGFMWGLLLSILLSPLLGLIIVLLSGKKYVVDPEVEKLRAEIELLKNN